MLIICGHFLLSALAYYIGTALSSLDIRLSPSLCLLFAAVYGTTAFFYPSMKHNRFTGSWKYVCRKTGDFLLVASSFCLICWLVNDLQELPIAAEASAAAIRSVPPAATEILSSSHDRKAGSLTHAEKKTLKKELRKKIREFKKAQRSGNLSFAEQVILIILAIAVALGLAYLVAALACSLSCSGAEGLATLVAIVGLGGIIFGLVKIIQSIIHGGRRPPPPPNVKPAIESPS